MKDIFRLTFITITDIKFWLLVLVVSILTLFEPFPFIGYVALIFEKILYFSVGAFLLFLLENSKDFEFNYKKNSFSSMILHFFPVGVGVVIGLMVISFFWFIFFIMILQFADGYYLLANPHTFLPLLSEANIILKILIGFYLVYFLFYSYIFLGKLGEALLKSDFKDAFLTILSSLWDFNYWIRCFNLGYFKFYTLWMFIVGILYLILIFGYLFIVFPTIIHNPNISLVIIPILVASTTILTIFTFFSAYFAHKTTN